MQWYVGFLIFIHDFKVKQELMIFFRNKYCKNVNTNPVLLLKVYMWILRNLTNIYYTNQFSGTAAIIDLHVKAGMHCKDWITFQGVEYVSNVFLIQSFTIHVLYNLFPRWFDCLFVFFNRLKCCVCSIDHSFTTVCLFTVIPFFVVFFLCYVFFEKLFLTFTANYIYM